jgi:DNA-directed RNA polymerase specialized sigma subunit
MSSLISDLPLTKEKIFFEINQLRSRLSREPTNDEIASHLNLPKNYIDRILPRPFLHNKYQDNTYDPSELSSTPLRDLSELNKNGGKSKKSLNKNKKKHKKLSRRRRHDSKKNRKSMKRK